MTRPVKASGASVQEDMRQVWIDLSPLHALNGAGDGEADMILPVDATRVFELDPETALHFIDADLVGRCL